MEFEHPEILYITLGVLVPVMLIITFWARWRRRKDLLKFGNSKLIGQLTEHISAPRRILRTLALLGGLLLLGLALAGPQYGVKMVEVLRQGVDVIVALDVSKSMLAEDVRPNRLERAKQELTAFIDQLGGDRVGVIAFAGSAQVACPLTTDYTAAKMFLNYLTPHSVARGGTELGTAVRAATELFPEGSEGYRVIVLLTDGEDHDSKVMEAAQEAKAAGIKILCIGFGTPEGEPIPLRNDQGEITGYVKDSRGKTVVSQLDENTLKKITAVTNGAYLPAHHGSLEAKQIADLIDKMQKRDVSGGQYGASENRYQFILLPALLLLLFSFWLPERKGSWLTVLIIMLLLPHVALAGTADDVNKGNRHYKKGQYDKALESYRDAQIKAPNEPRVNYNLGNTLHQQKRYKEANEAYGKALKSKEKKLRAETLYNMGNTYFKQQDYEDAIKHYREALKLQPNDEDTIYNLAQAIRVMKNPPPKQKQQDKDKQGKKGKQNKQEQKQQGQQQQEQQAGKEDKDKGEGKDQPKPAKEDDKGEKKADAGQSQDTPEGDQKTQPKPGEMRPEEAENILNAVREAEKEAQKERMKKMQQQPSGHGKADW